MKFGYKIIIIIVLLSFAFGCVSEDTSTNHGGTIQDTDDTDVPEPSSLTEDEEVVETPATSNDTENTNDIDIVQKTEQETDDFVKSTGYEADVNIDENNMNVYFDTTKFTKTDIHTMVSECLNTMTDYLPNQRVHVSFYDGDDQEIAFGRYTDSNERTIIYIYEYAKYPDVKKTTEELFDSYGFDADVEISQRGMLVYFHTKGVTDSDLHTMSEKCVKIMVRHLPDQMAKVAIYNDADQLIADGYYIDWTDQIDVMVY
ncbi:Hypothetical protein Mbur_0555 [Methanococcoides burtonii DSM 6242]|uniref:Uncharacterized protein n=2 Tax=Methanococcoides burtonii TaxID=29291 RepID=Q12YE6_METBU|nr:Hypothetical protein Mbur_0555 [Methanococcoides burtonii DSM 6242]